MNTKTNTFKYFALLLLFVSTIFSSDYYSVKFINSDFGFLCGTDGVLLRTTDAGFSWNSINTPGNSNINDIAVLGESAFLLLTENGIQMTTDNGESWEPKTAGITEVLKSVVLTHEGSLFACGPNSSLYVSNDLGNTWQRVEVNTSSNFNKIIFIDGYNGYVVGSNSTLLITSDGGNSWTVKSVSASRTNLTSISMNNDREGIITGDGGFIIVTISAWQNWKKITPPSGDKNLFDVSYRTTNNPFITGENFILNSTDNGSSWNYTSILNQSQLPAKLNSICYPNINNGIIVGSNNTILLSHDGGQSWQYLNPLNEITRKNNEKNLVSLSNYPNPFNPSTVISYEVPFDSYVTLKVFDINGKEVAELSNSYKAAGNYNITFNSANLSSGIYFYTLISENNISRIIKTNKMLIVK